MKNKTAVAQRVRSVAENAQEILQKDKEERAKRAGERISKILQEENCTLDVAIILRNGQHPFAQTQIIALDPTS